MANALTRQWSLVRWKLPLNTAALLVMYWDGCTTPRVSCPSSKKADGSFDMNVIPEKDRTMQLKEMEKQFKWFRKEGKTIDVGAIEQEEKYEQAKTWHSSGNRQIGQELMLWLRQRQETGTVNTASPGILRKLETLFQAWNPKKKSINLNDPALVNDVLAALDWWCNAKYPCDPDSVSRPGEKKKD